MPLSHGHDDEHSASTRPEEPAVEEEGETAIAEYDYEAQEENELSFPEGAVIINIERVDDNWWAGEYQGNSGLFPCTSPTTPPNPPVVGRPLGRILDCWDRADCSELCQATVVWEEMVLLVRRGNGLKVDRISLFLKFEVFISQIQIPFHSPPNKPILDSESINNNKKSSNH